MCLGTLLGSFHWDQSVTVQYRHSPGGSESNLLVMPLVTFQRENDIVFCSTLMAIACCVITIKLEGEDKDWS